MKFLHISDLHLGRQLHRFPLQEEQIEILEHIRQAVAEEKPDAVLIAGDVYDRSIPPVYATQMLDDFLTALIETGTNICMISGNHDSAERVGFLSGPLSASGLHVSPAYRGEVEHVTLADNEGLVDVWLLPYLRPAAVRPFFPDESIENTNDAVACVLASIPLDRTRRNVLVAHQFVAGAALSGSEDACALLKPQDLTVGGSDLVEARLFSDFDYVALGHLHHAQNVTGSRGVIRYCGTPLKYSFSELNSNKSITVVNLAGDHSVTIRLRPLPEPRRLQEIRGLFSDVMSEESIASTDRDAYTHVILTDDHPIPDVITRLRQVYPNFTHLDWDNTRTRSEAGIEAASDTDARQHTPQELFSTFFEQVNGASMTREQADYMDQLIRSIWEGEA